MILIEIVHIEFQLGLGTIQQYVPICAFFHKFFDNIRQHRYDLICAVDIYETENNTGYYSVISGGGISIPNVSKTYEMQSLYVSLNFMDTWLKVWVEHQKR